MSKCATAGLCETGWCKCHMAQKPDDTAWSGLVHNGLQRAVKRQTNSKQRGKMQHFRCWGERQRKIDEEKEEGRGEQGKGMKARDREGQKG